MTLVNRSDFSWLNKLPGFCEETGACPTCSGCSILPVCMRLSRFGFWPKWWIVNTETPDFDLCLSNRIKHWSCSDLLSTRITQWWAHKWNGYSIVPWQKHCISSCLWLNINRLWIGLNVAPALLLHPEALLRETGHCWCLDTTEPFSHIRLCLSGQDKTVMTTCQP